MIVGINGYAGSGKDTIGKIIQDEYSELNWEIKKFAGKLKTIASILTSIPEEKFEHEHFKKKNLDRCWWTTCDEGYVPMTVREFLQKLGTDALRNGLHTNVWVNALMSEYKRPISVERFMYIKGYAKSEESITKDMIDPEYKAEYEEEVKPPNWIITDVRFPNEARAIKNKGGIVIRVNRPGVSPINNHPSEVGLDDWKFDYVINNDSSVDHLTNLIIETLDNQEVL